MHELCVGTFLVLHQQNIDVCEKHCIFLGFKRLLPNTLRWPDTLSSWPDTLSSWLDTLSSGAEYAHTMAGYAQFAAEYAHFLETPSTQILVDDRLFFC